MFLNLVVFNLWDEITSFHWTVFIIPHKPGESNNNALLKGKLDLPNSPRLIGDYKHAPLRARTYTRIYFMSRAAAVQTAAIIDRELWSRGAAVAFSHYSLYILNRSVKAVHGRQKCPEVMPLEAPEARKLGPPAYCLPLLRSHDVYLQN